MATKTQDYTKMMKDMMGSFPVDMSAFQDAFKTQAVLA
ncbi:MAG: phasin, PhaP, partial [Rhodobacteraceae bacterium]|nr:phasin, PhaP [Paracoccaceae bacterium]